MKVIGITGGIGSGKSEVLKFLKQLGYYVIEADKLSHSLMEKGEKAYNRIVDEFGSGILDDAGNIDRVVFREIVFGDEKALGSLNAIVHPAVKDYIINDIREKTSSNQFEYYFIEAALLIQDGYKSICDEIWYIYADVDIRLERLVAGRGGSKEFYRNIVSKQESEDYYRDNSNIVIDNSADFSLTMNKIKELLNIAN